MAGFLPELDPIVPCMPKPVVFISHIAPEKEVAIAFKELIEASFLGMIEIFVSSDEHSIQVGQRWLDDITNALEICSIEIILCSPQSIKRPWINFEAGAGWIRKIPVIPLCHSGMEPRELPLPLNLLQAAIANQVSSLNLVLPVLAQAVGSSTPRVDFADFFTRVTEFELRYTYWDACNAAFTKLHAIDPLLIAVLRTGQVIEFQTTETQIGKFEAIVSILTEHNILGFRRTGKMKIDARGTTFSCSLIPLPKLAETFDDANFHF